MLFRSCVFAEVDRLCYIARILGPLWQVPDEHACAQLMPFWAGQAAALMRELPAGIGAIDVVPSLSGRSGL